MSTPGKNTPTEHMDKNQEEEEEEEKLKTRIPKP
jgi:hypothetical protein